MIHTLSPFKQTIFNTACFLQTKHNRGVKGFVSPVPSLPEMSGMSSKEGLHTLQSARAPECSHTVQASQEAELLLPRHILCGFCCTLQKQTLIRPSVLRALADQGCTIYCACVVASMPCCN